MKSTKTTHAAKKEGHTHDEHCYDMNVIERHKWRKRCAFPCAEHTTRFLVYCLSPRCNVQDSIHKYVRDACESVIPELKSQLELVFLDPFERLPNWLIKSNVYVYDIRDDRLLTLERDVIEWLAAHQMDNRDFGTIQVSSTHSTCGCDSDCDDGASRSSRCSNSSSSVACQDDDDDEDEDDDEEDEDEEVTLDIEVNKGCCKSGKPASSRRNVVCDDDDDRDDDEEYETNTIEEIDIVNIPIKCDNEGAYKATIRQIKQRQKQQKQRGATNPNPPAHNTASVKKCKAKSKTPIGPTEPVQTPEQKACQKCGRPF